MKNEEVYWGEIDRDFRRTEILGVSRKCYTTNRCFSKKGQQYKMYLRNISQLIFKYILNHPLSFNITYKKRVAEATL